MEFDQNNRDWKKAERVFREMDDHLLLTGKAGTGKTTFLHEVIQKGVKKFVVVAPTGIAAIHSGGETLHRFFKFSFSPYHPEDSRLSTDPEKEENIWNHFQYSKAKLELLDKLDTIVIDEISMVRCDLLDAMDKLLRVFLKNQTPFGGKQMVFIGDPFQLPPVKGEGWDVLWDHYSSPWFFRADAFQQILQERTLRAVELKKVFRQEKDHHYTNILNRLREGNFSSSDIETLNTRYKPDYHPDSDPYITLTTTNRKAESINQRRLKELSDPSSHLKGRIKGNFRESELPTPETLELKHGAQVMFLRNDPGGNWVNGTIGKVVGIGERNIQVVNVYGKELTVERVRWEKRKYYWAREEKRVRYEILGTFDQFPVKPAWAITIHKSQGRTFKLMILDLRGSNIFTEGQLYVALSRCTSLEGLILKERIDPSDVMVDEDVVDFMEQVLGDDPSKEALANDEGLKQLASGFQDLKNGNLEAAIGNLISGVRNSEELDDPRVQRLMRGKLQQLLGSSGQYKGYSSDTSGTEGKVLEKGQVVTGKVERVTSAYVHLSLHEVSRKGKIHKKELSDREVRNPASEVSLGQTIKARVLKIRKRHGVLLSRKGLDEEK